jgi:hypothetical protein
MMEWSTGALALLRTEERTIRLDTSANMEVEGIVRVRSLQLGVADQQYVFEQHEPIAVSTRINGQTKRVTFEQPRSHTGIAAYIGVALAARIAVRVLAHRRRRT